MLTSTKTKTIMKYLTSSQFFELAEMTVRANGKTTETIRAALNFLINGHDQYVMYVGYTNQSCDYARKIATQMLQEADPVFQIEITRNNRYVIEFWSVFGRSVLRFANWTTIPYSVRGMTLNEIFFDIDPETLFRDSLREESKVKEIWLSVAPMFAYRKPAKNNTIKIF
jgi:hypothetical protein